MSYIVYELLAMGQTLGTAAQWTSASKDGVGKLELTAANEVILNKIIAFIDGFPSRHSDEAKVTFKQPFVWTSELSAADFSSGYTLKSVIYHLVVFLYIKVGPYYCNHHHHHHLYYTLKSE